jgi:hypothetical protein
VGDLKGANRGTSDRGVGNRLGGPPGVPRQAKTETAAEASPVKTFPFRATRFDGAPIRAWWDGDQIRVKQPMNVFHNRDFAAQTATLDPETFTVSGARLDPAERVRLHVYDPPWYLPNITGSTWGDREFEIELPAERLVELSGASRTATLKQIGLSLVEGASMGVPWGRLLEPLVQSARPFAAAAMIGTADVAPSATGAVTSRAAIGAVERGLTSTIVTQRATSTVAQAVVPASERLVTGIAPAVPTGALPYGAIGTGLAVAGLEAGGKEFTSAVMQRVVSGQEPLVDSMVAVALDKWIRNQTLPVGQRLRMSPMENLIVAKLRGQGVLTPDTVVRELANRIPAQATAMVPRQVATTAAARQAIKKILEDAGVGAAGAKGVMDREIVRQGLLAETAPGIVPSFYTADKQVINGLAELAGIQTQRLGQYKVAEYLLYKRGTDSFEVVIDGYRLLVRPIQIIRPPR